LDDIVFCKRLKQPNITRKYFFSNQF